MECTNGIRVCYSGSNDFPTSRVPGHKVRLDQSSGYFEIRLDKTSVEFYGCATARQSKVNVRMIV